MCRDMHESPSAQGASDSGLGSRTTEKLLSAPAEPADCFSLGASARQLGRKGREHSCLQRAVFLAASPIPHPTTGLANRGERRAGRKSEDIEGLNQVPARRGVDERCKGEVRKRRVWYDRYRVNAVEQMRLLDGSDEQLIKSDQYGVALRGSRFAAAQQLAGQANA